MKVTAVTVTPSLPPWPIVEQIACEFQKRANDPDAYRATYVRNNFALAASLLRDYVAELQAAGEPITIIREIYGVLPDRSKP